MKLKQNFDFKSLFEDQIQGKLNEINSQSDNFTEENEKLREQIKKEKNKLEGFSDRMKKFNTNFEKAKKKYTKIMNDMLSIKKENQELKSIDVVSLKQEIEKNKIKLDNYVQKNKDLQNKIKE